MAEELPRHLHFLVFALSRLLGLDSRFGGLLHVLLPLFALAPAVTLTLTLARAFTLASVSFTQSVFWFRIRLNQLSIVGGKMFHLAL